MSLDGFVARDEGGKGRFCPTREEVHEWQRHEERVREELLLSGYQRVENGSGE